LSSVRDSAKILAEFGQGLGGLGQVEASTGSGKGLGDAMAQLAATVDGLAATAALHAEAQGSDLHEPFEEYTRLVASARLALQQRADKKVGPRDNQTRKAAIVYQCTVLTSVAYMLGCPQTAYIDALTDVEVKTMGHHKVATVAGKEDAANKQVHTHTFREPRLYLPITSCFNPQNVLCVFLCSTRCCSGRRRRRRTPRRSTRP